MNSISRRDSLLFLFMLILVPLAGEPKFHPFDGALADFRVSFGSPVFLLFLLGLRQLSPTLLGLSAGFSVMLFRTLLDVSQGAAFDSALYAHIATMVYYTSYAIIFGWARIHPEKYSTQAIRITLFAILAELVASLAELAVMGLCIGHPIYQLTLPMMGKLLLIACLRCVFILSFFFLFQLHLMENTLLRKTKEKNRLALLISNLYEEVFELKYSQHQAEKVTHDCYQLYESLQARASSPEDKALAQELLRLAGECHEIKKNNLRIYAGLSELTNNRHVEDYLPAASIVKLLIHTNSKYARSLGKNITFTSHVGKGIPPLQAFFLLSILGNLLVNAVEAIKQEGTILLSIQRGKGQDILQIKVENTGSEIPPRRLQRLFQPGYTTKFDETGKASSGMGLTYVKHQMETIEGEIQISSPKENTVVCDLTLPWAKITRPTERTENEHTTR